MVFLCSKASLAPFACVRHLLSVRLEGWHLLSAPPQPLDIRFALEDKAIPPQDDDYLMVGTVWKNSYVDDESKNKRGVSKLKYPVKHGTATEYARKESIT